MPARPPTFRPAWLARAPKAVERERVARRGTAAERGYDSKWVRAARAFRVKHPSCAYCMIEGRAAPAELVDHLYPHGLRRGVADLAARKLFWSSQYWVSSCGLCHRTMKADAERRGIEELDRLAQRLGLAPLADQDLRSASIRALF